MLANNALQDKPFPKPILLLVAEKSHKKNWQDEFLKWHFNYNVTIACYASLHKYANYTFSMVICDEAHHLFSEKRLEAINSIQSPYTILLSATLKPSVVSQLTNRIFTFSTINLNKAIETEVLPTPKINIIEMSLDNTACDQYFDWGKSYGRITITCKYNDRFNFFARKMPVRVMCTQRQKYMYLNGQMDFWEEKYHNSNNDIFKNKWLQYGLKRKRYIGELKTQQVESLIKSLPQNERYICFCSSVDQCKQLGNNNAIHSKRKDNQQVIDSFNFLKSNSLYAVGMAVEGLNLRNINTAIIIQLDGNERPFLQKIGRSLRADSPTVYVFCYKDTQDEKYLQNAIRDIDPKYIKRLSFSELQ